MAEVIIPWHLLIENILEKVDGVDIDRGTYPRDDADP